MPPCGVVKMEDVVVEVRNLKKYFPIKLGFFKSLRSKEVPMVHAVDDVSFSIRSTEVLGLVGESGSGKTTTGRCLLRLIEPTEGKISFNGQDMASLSSDDMTKLRAKMQIIFQDPYASLNPRMNVYNIASEPLRIQRLCGSPGEMMERVTKVLEDMGLTPAQEFLYRFPHELSGGQRQRVAISRAFVVEPSFLVADEPVSMLDASIRTDVLDMMLGLVKRTRCSFLYITHDMALARYICNRIAVMYLGKIVEIGFAEDVIKNPFHPYTEALIRAVPVPDPTARHARATIKGEIPSPINPPSGCRFHTRCPYAGEICMQNEPALIEVGNEHFAACVRSPLIDKRSIK